MKAPTKTLPHPQPRELPSRERLTPAQLAAVHGGADAVATGKRQHGHIHSS
ncbi:MAG: hypothetical protein H6709_13425 [Kofleriaceae bacterium]|nr:hypothetical protein [Kofleriaceae bacterium]MCB9573079.1 hypothetical protein [Kofleriaceae bacterium]